MILSNQNPSKLNLFNYEKISSLSLSLLLASLTSANAKSDFYAGIDIQRQDLQLKTSSVILGDGSIFKPSVSKFYETKSYNPNLFLGFNANKNLDIELGYSMSDEDKKNNSTGIYSDDNGNSHSSSAGAIASTGNAYNVGTKSTLKTQNISLDKICRWLCNKGVSIIIRSKQSTVKNYWSTGSGKIN